MNVNFPDDDDVDGIVMVIVNGEDGSFSYGEDGSFSYYGRGGGGDVCIYRSY